MLEGCSKSQKCAGGAECVTIAGGVSYCACPKGMTPDDEGEAFFYQGITLGSQVYLSDH